MKVLQLPKCDVKIPVVVDMLNYLYTKTYDVIECGLARSDLTYFTYHLSLFQLSLRFYLPELEKIAKEALGKEEIGIQEEAWGELEHLIVDMYNNRHGRKWESLRKVVLKGQAWKLIKMPSETLNKLEERFPGCRCELAEAWRLKLMEFGASGDSRWTRWRK
jgi:hypothetical protein